MNLNDREGAYFVLGFKRKCQISCKLEANGWNITKRSYLVFII